MDEIRLPASAWAGVWRRTGVITLVSSLGSLGIAQAIMLTLSQGLNEAGAIASLILPIILGSPILFYFQLRSAQLREANRRLEALASTDWLTDCLNRRAFTSRVSASLKGTGALLVIDADHFKTINDRFGHERGDEVLQLIAAAIRDNVRDSDFVGRLGGEEFGVFLKDAGLDIATPAAERIRSAVNALFVTSDGMAQRLSVSIGGAVCIGDAGFADLFRMADRRLYEAKHAGRNRVVFGDTAERAALSAVNSAIG
jgi:diguanylate cyclase (GGDEF)-like protein